MLDARAAFAVFDWWWRVLRFAVWGPLIALVPLFAGSAPLYWAVFTTGALVWFVALWRSNVWHRRAMNALKNVPPREALGILDERMPKF